MKKNIIRTMGVCFLMVALHSCTKEVEVIKEVEIIKEVEDLTRINDLQGRISDLNLDLNESNQLNEKLNDSIDVVNEVLNFIEDNTFVLLTDKEFSELYEIGDDIIINGLTYTIHYYGYSNLCGAFYDNEDDAIADSNSPRYSDVHEKWWINSDCSITTEGNMYVSIEDATGRFFQWNYGIEGKIGLIYNYLHGESLRWGSRWSAEIYGGTKYNAYPEDGFAYYHFELGTLPLHMVSDAFTR